MMISLVKPAAKSGSKFLTLQMKMLLSNASDMIVRSDDLSESNTRESNSFDSSQARSVFYVNVPMLF